MPVVSSQPLLSPALQTRRVQRWGWMLLAGLALATSVGGTWLVVAHLRLIGTSGLRNDTAYQRALSERILRLTRERRLAGAPLEVSDADSLADAIRSVREYQPMLVKATGALPAALKPFHEDRIAQIGQRFLAAAEEGDVARVTSAQREFFTAVNQLVSALQRDAESRAVSLRTGLVTLLLAQLALAAALGAVVLRALGNANETIELELQERRQVRQMLEMIQSISGREELAQTLGTHLPQVLPGLSGSVHLFSPSRDVIEQVGQWGSVPSNGEEIVLTECWGLRLGKAYGSNDASHVRCSHVGAGVGGHWCMPMLAEGEGLGMFHIRTASGKTITDLQRERASRLAEGLAVTLANMRLRETLRNQSIRDPLTSVFNRRYMEESLTRELRRAKRRGQQVSVIMLDLDHFKVLNDTFGHAVGDELLCAFGRFLTNRCRAEDIVCRYGGEEFVLIFPEMTPADATAKAEALRAGWMGHSVSNGNGVRVSATFSGGTATFPDDGITTETIISAADAALYAAKSQGRDRVVNATEELGPRLIDASGSSSSSGAQLTRASHSALVKAS